MKSSLIIKIVIGVLSVITVGTGTYLYINNDNEAKENDTNIEESLENTTAQEEGADSLEAIEEINEETEEGENPIEEEVTETTNEEDPSARFIAARDTQRTSDINMVITGFSMYIGDGGTLETISTCSTENLGLQIGTRADNHNLDYLLSTYLPSIPEDPTTGSTAATGYYICLTQDGRYQISAISEATGEMISVTR